jgi:hypothetical protein
VNKITQRITPQKNIVILSGPSNIGKSLIFKPIFDIYKNVSVSNVKDFSLDDCLSEELVFCDNTNICLKYNKNVLFKNDVIATTLLDGKTYGDGGASKIVFSITRDGIYYIDNKFGTRMLIIELNDKIPKYIDNVNINEEDGCSIILNLLLNTNVIKEYIHSQRIDNNWDKNCCFISVVYAQCLTYETNLTITLKNEYIDLKT